MRPGEAARRTTMSLPPIVTRGKWLAARKDLLDEEKELTRRRDALSARRRELPMVEITEDYAFTGVDGPATLLDLFDGRPQLIVYHFMFHPDWEDGCSSCTAGVSEVAPGFLEHLATRDTTYVLASRAPIEKLQRWSQRQGFVVPWFSTDDGPFSYDFGATIDAARGYDTFNYRTLDEYAALGHESMRDSAQPYDMPGQSCFVQVDGRIFHTYSTYARGLEATGGSYYFLDNTVLGRQEDWEEPKGRSDSIRGAQPDFAS